MTKRAVVVGINSSRESNARNRVAASDSITEFCASSFGFDPGSRFNSIYSPMLNTLETLECDHKRKE